MDKDKQQPLNYEDCDVGRLVNRSPNGKSGFKVAVIVGYTRTGKIRICVWSDNSHGWSLPQNYYSSQLYAIDYATLSPRHRLVLKHAHQHILDNGNAVAAVKLIPHHEGKLVRDAAGNVHFSRAKAGAR